MIKLLDDLLIAATCNPNVPGAIVAGLRKALDEARAAQPSPTSAPQPADGPYRVCVKEIATSARTIKIGEVYPGSPDRARHPECWLPCDKDGWVSGSLSGPVGPDTEWRGHPGLSDWRPMRQSTGHADAIPKASALDEMAEQVRRWAAPTQPVAICREALAATLTERGKRYGKFVDHARITQDIKDVMRACPKWAGLAPDQKEALEMVAHKVGRILNGDPDYDDSWIDVAGYSKLVGDRLQGVTR